VAAVPGVSIAPNADVVAGSDIVFLCLLARVAKAELPGLPFRADQSVLSVMVDAPLALLYQLCAPASRISITIPLPPIAYGGCPLPVYPASAALEALYGDRNLILPQPSEAALNAHLAASALCSPILDQVLAAGDWLGHHTGNPAAAEAYVAAMIRAYLPERARGGELAAALQMLSTEGGLNATLRARMAPARTVLSDGLDSLRARLRLPEDQER
ncbi:MAG TPA: pyrroline-5-carboxylate reductase, partial [Tabrizicola sp.]